MFCPTCGAPNEDDAVFCGNCGGALDPDSAPVEDVVSEELGEEVVVVEADPAEPAAPPPAVEPLAAPPTSNLAVASMVLGVAGLTLLPLLGGILAIILGYMARAEIRDRPDEVSGDGLALAGIVMGWITVGLALVGCLVFGGLAVCGVLGAFGASGY